MSWDEYARARRQLAEERVGAPQRIANQAEIDAEDASVEATKAAIRRTRGL